MLASLKLIPLGPATKVVGLLLAFLRCLASPMLTPGISIYFWHTDAPARVFPVHIGVVIGALLLVAWALITAAIAWELCPKIGLNPQFVN